MLARSSSSSRSIRNRVGSSARVSRYKTYRRYQQFKIAFSLKARPAFNLVVSITSVMQGIVWGEPELLYVWIFDHMVFFHSHNVNEV